MDTLGCSGQERGSGVGSLDRGGRSWHLASASFAMAISSRMHTPACVGVGSGLFIALCPSHPSTFLLLELKQLNSSRVDATEPNSPGLVYTMFLELKSPDKRDV